MQGEGLWLCMRAFDVHKLNRVLLCECGCLVVWRKKCVFSECICKILMPIGAKIFFLKYFIVILFFSWGIRLAIQLFK